MNFGAPWLLALLVVVPLVALVAWLLEQRRARYAVAFTNLDVLASREIREFMVESKNRGKCVIFSTHVLHDAERLCDRVTIIHQGRVVASGATADVRGQYPDLEDSFMSLVEAAR